MHNKSFTVDNQVSIDRRTATSPTNYFEAGDDLSFADFDVMVVGRSCRRFRRNSTCTGTALGLSGAPHHRPRTPALGRANSQRGASVAGDANKYADADRPDARRRRPCWPAS
jgi:phosphatidylserine/phosphatidylglycerophosphate/cardiolipin synthase-like enzyme